MKKKFIVAGMIFEAEADELHLFNIFNWKFATPAEIQWHLLLQEVIHGKLKVGLKH